MNTRIKRYAKLRQQIEEEIQMIKLKNENNKKVLFYKKKIDQIDPKAFDQINQKIKKQFPNLNFLFQVKNTTENNDLEKDKQEINKWLEVIQDIQKEEKQQPKTLNDYAPNSTNENFVLQKTKSWKENQEQNKIFFTRMIKFKEKIEKNEIRTKLKKSENVQLLQTINSVNNKIQNYDQKLEFVLKSKKQKTKWIFWVNLFIFSVLFTCLIIILIN